MTVMTNGGGQRHYKGIIYHTFVSKVNMVLNGFVFKFVDWKVVIYVTSEVL